MKKLLSFSAVLLVAAGLHAQTHPEPEYTNEVYFMSKDDGNKLTRLEKGASDVKTKMKLAGFGGGDSGYELDGSKSDVRLPSGKLVFVISNGASVKSSNPQSDSVMRANGVDPSMMNMDMGVDPTSMISLYKGEVAKGGKRIFVMQGAPGMMGIGKKYDNKTYTLSIKKIREGYWEITVDKPLEKGEYTFVNMMQGNSQGGHTLYAFGID